MRGYVIALAGFLLTAGAYLGAANLLHSFAAAPAVVPFDLPGPLVYDSCDPGGRLTRPLLSDPALRLQVKGAQRFREDVSAPERTLSGGACSPGTIDIEYAGDLDRVYDDLKARIPSYGWSAGADLVAADPAAFFRRGSYFTKGAYRLELYESDGDQSTRPSVAIVVSIPAART